MTQASSVSVVIPVHDGGEGFRECLQALAETEPAPGEIIVVADGDPGDAARIAESFGAHVLRMPVRSGPAHARNRGACAATGDVLLFVDADVLVYPDAIAHLAEVFAREPDLAAVFGSYDDRPAASNFLSQYRNLLHHYVHQTAREEATTFWAGYGAIRRDTFLSVGGFDTGYGRPAIEDIELGYRLKQAGHRLRLCKTLQATHLKEWSALSLLKTDFLYRALPWTELILRDRRFVNDLNLQTSSRLSVIAVCGLFCALLTSCWWPPSLVVAGLASLALLMLNMRLYAFFLRKRGPWFALRTIPCHWLYYFYSGAAFALGSARYLFAHAPRARRGVE